MPFPIPSSKQFPWDQALSYYLRQLSDGSTGSINVWKARPTSGVDGQALGQNHVGYTGVDLISSSLIRWNGSSWDVLMDGDKIVSTTQLDLYVSQNSGSDSNDGKTSSTAWQTISKFYQEVNKYNLLGKQINLYLGAGTYRIQFPPNTWGGTIKILGASNASTTIQVMSVTKGTLVMIQDVTVAYPQVLDSSPFYWPISLSESSSLQFGQNVVLGPVGNYIPGNARFHVSANNSSVTFIAGLPVTLTGSVNNVLNLVKGQIWVATYYNPTAGAVTPNTAPAVDTGATYTYLPTPTSSDVLATVNASGNVTVGNLIYLNDGAIVNGPPGWRLAFNGSITGSAYTLYNSSSINGYVSKGPNSQGIAYPTSISSGTKDATSTLIGTAF